MPVASLADKMEKTPYLSAFFFLESRVQFVFTALLTANEQD